MSIESVMPSNHLVLCRQLLLLPSICPRIRVFSSESTYHIKWPKYWASASAFPMNIQGWFPLGLTGLIFFAVQGSLKSLLQHHNSKASILQRSAFLMIQLSHSYMTIGETTAFTILYKRVIQKKRSTSWSDLPQIAFPVSKQAMEAALLTFAQWPIHWTRLPILWLPILMAVLQLTLTASLHPCCEILHTKEPADCTSCVSSNYVASLRKVLGHS